MKTKLTIITASGIIGGMAVITLSQALAIQPPPDLAEPPAPLLNEVKNSPIPNSPNSSSIIPRLPAYRAPSRIPNMPKLAQDVPFIGVATVTVPDMVSDHLGLHPGSGVIIRTVCPGSPAEKAGLSVNDIILSVGDTAVGDPEALSSTISQHKPGDRIAIDLIHKGKPAKVEVTLSERPADQVAGGNQEPPMFEGLPKDHADRLRSLIERNMNAFGAEDSLFPDADLENSLRMMREQMSQAMGGALAPVQPRQDGEISFQQNSTVRMMDNEGSIEIQSSGGDTEVTVRDVNNDKIWSGPWNTDADKSAAPQSIRERVEKAGPGSGTGFSFGFGNLRGAPPAIPNH